MLIPGAVVDGRYVAESLLGVGGMAEVWAVVHQRLGARRALKVLRFGDAGLGRRLLAEGQIQAGLDHPNLLPVLDVVDVDGAPGLVLPLVDGTSLESALLLARPRPAEAASLLRGVLAGLRHAHQAGVAHRDLKPANVLLARHDGGVVPRIADFGVAVAVAGGGAAAGSFSLGTPGYAAPEQLAGRSPAGVAADWWSFGALAFELLSGRRPGARGVSEADLAEHGSGWRDLVVELLDPDPARRLQDPEGIDGRLAALGGESGTLHGAWAVAVHARAPATLPVAPEAQPAGSTGNPRYASQAGANPRLVPAVDLASGRTVTLVPFAPEEAERVRHYAPLVHPNLVPLRDVVWHPWARLVVDSLEGAESLEAAIGGSSLTVRVEAVAELLEAVAHLHGAGVVGGLSTRHVGVSGGGVRVLPFGAGLHEGESDALEAPELSAGRPASVATDLYAVGLLAHSLLAGTPAFAGRTAAARLHAQLTAPLALDAAGLDEPLVAFLRGVLAADPLQRFPTARDALAALRASPSAPSAPRARAAEAELQGGAVLGRVGELAAITRAVGRLADGGSGAMLLVGESGVGKSRVLAAARGIAWAAGARVLLGRVEPAGLTPYAPLMDGVRVLAREVELSPEERFALSPLLASGGPTASPVVGTIAVDRVGAALRAVLGRVRAPVVWQLDDLQWAGDDLYALVEELVRAPLPRVLLLGTWRDDVSPTRPRSLSAFAEVPVPRLGKDAATELCRRVLGDAADALGPRLHRETGGNPLFLVESLRELRRAPAGAGLDGDRLPLRTPAVSELLAARVARVPEEHHARLELAAVLGRQIDLGVLAAVSGAAGLTEWVEELERRAVIERSEGELRFVHHKVMEALVAGMPPERLRERAAQLAEALTAQGGAGGERPGEIARLWELAGNRDREAEWRPRAGEQALARGADADAVRHLTRAVELRGADPDAVTVARLHRLLGEAHFARGSFTEASAHLEGALERLGHRLPDSPGGWVRCLLGALARQIWHRLSEPSVPDESATRGLREVARAYGKWNSIWIFRGRAVEYLSVALLSLNAADRAGEVSPQGAGALALASSMLGFRRQAEYYVARATAWGERHEAWGELAELNMHLASVRVGQGDLAAAERQIATAGGYAARSGQAQLIALVNGLTGLCAAFRGEFGTALAAAERCLETWRQPQGMGMRIGHLVARSLTLERIGRGAESLEQLEAHRDYAPPYDRMSKGFVLSHLSLLYARVGRFADAAATAEAAVRYTDEEGIAPPGLSPYLEANPTEAVLRCVLAARRAGTPGEADLLAVARRHVARLRRYARQHASGRPELAVMEGALLRLEGREERAVATWRQGAGLAASLDHRFNEWRLKLLLSGSRAVPAPERTALRTEAVAALTAAGAGAVVVDYDEWWA